LLDANKVDDFSLRHMKTEAKFVVGQHKSLTACRQHERHSARVAKRRQIEHLARRMHVHLTAAERDGWNVVGVDPVGAESAVADRAHRLTPYRGNGCLSQLYALVLRIEAKRLIIEPALKPYAASLALCAFDFLRGTFERPLNRANDLIAEFR